MIVARRSCSLFYLLLSTSLLLNLCLIYSQRFNSVAPVQNKEDFVFKIANDELESIKETSRNPYNLELHTEKVEPKFPISDHVDLVSSERSILLRNLNAKLPEKKEKNKQPGKLQLIRVKAIEKQRNAIKQEMKGYKYQTEDNSTLETLLIENGGKPIRNIIVTTWRSGSTFLGAAVASHPATFYQYEPMEHFGIKQVRWGSLGKEGLNVMNDVLNCNFTNQQGIIEHSKTHSWVFSVNSRVWQYCKANQKVCHDGQFMSDMCKLFPFQLIKTVRLRLRLAATLLENNDFDVRIVLLVRDPRGTMQSRNHRDWCPMNADCYDPSRLCMDLEDDFAEAKILREKYPDRFTTIRYEDLSFEPYKGIQKVLKFFRLQYHPKVVQYLKSHTTENKGGVGSTYRDSKNTALRWREDFVGNFSKVLDIQSKCKEAMKLWGYAEVSDSEDIQTFNPLKDPPWPEMTILDNEQAITSTFKPALLDEKLIEEYIKEPSLDTS